MDLVLKLRGLRARAGLTQEDVAARSHIGAKSISSFESGARIDSMKLSQLEAILRVYGITLAQFFSRSSEHDLAPWESPQDPIDAIARRIETLPSHMRDAMAEKISTMLDAIEAVLPHPRRTTSSDASHATLH